MSVEWSREYETILIGRCDKARCMGWLCVHASNYYNTQRTYLLVPASVISWILNVFGMVATYVGKEKLSEATVILIVSLGNFIVATLTSIAERSKAGDKVELFNQTARDYNLVASQIKHQLMLPPENRRLVTKVIEETEKKYNDLMRSTPNIPDPITKSFMKVNANRPGFDCIEKPEGLLELKPSKYSSRAYSHRHLQVEEDECEKYRTNEDNFKIKNTRRHLLRPTFKDSKHNKDHIELEVFENKYTDISGNS